MNRAVKIWRSGRANAVAPDVSVKGSVLKSRRSWWSLLILIGLGWVGNIFPVPLFFGVDFLSGNIFVFLALAMFGTMTGMGVAALAGASTYFLWGHPYAWINMLIQVFLVGLAIRYKRGTDGPRNIPTWVVLYWLLVGLPLIAGCYHYALGLGWQGASMVAFKQACNDVFNALMAALALHYLPLRRWSGGSAEGDGRSLLHLQTNLLAAFAFFPALVVITLASRAEVTAIEEAIKARLITRSAAMSGDLHQWIDERMQIAQGLARQVELGKSLTDAALGRDLRFFAASSTAIAAVHIIDESGRVVLSSDTALSAKRVDLSDREWFARLRAQGKPVLALIPMGRMLPEPLVVFVAPVMRATQDGVRLLGGVVLTYKARSFQNMFSSDVQEDSMRATLLGRDDTVIVSSEPRFAPAKGFNQQRGGSVVERLGEVYRWRPEGAASPIQAWSSSYYARHVAIGDYGWNLVIELPIKPRFASLQQKILNDFIVTFALALGAFLVGGWLGRRLLRPLTELSEATRTVARNVSGDEPMRLHHHGMKEIDSLVDNFQSMAQSLKQKYDELSVIRRDLEQRVEERTADLTHQAVELERAKDEAESASRAKSDFLSSMSHELRTPMNAILGFGQLMEYGDALSEEHKDNVREIIKAGHHLLHLINDVLDLARIESGRIELSMEPVEIDPIIGECLSLVGVLAEKRHIQLRHSAMQGAAVRADRTRLRQVLLNLLSNAIKYNRDGGSVRIEARAQGADRMRILVTDTGVGIPAARLSELFQPFSRLGNENSGIEGTGIGLTITRRNVELMGGTVNVESEVGVGSRFWIELPLESLPLSDQDHEGTSATNTKQQPKHIETAQHTILYIEDNPSNLKLVAQILGRRKHIHLLTAHTPERGIELALARRPDLILLDINMPGMDGYQVLEVFRADVNLKQIPVVAITANAMLHDIERDRAADFTDYLSKPLDFGQFLTTIDRCLGGGEENANHAGRTDSR